MGRRSNDSEFPYLHGFTEEEQDRLWNQAKFSEQTLYKHVDFSEQRHILEIGSGVGGQSEILLRRFPHLKITCIELNENQIRSAEKRLSALSYCKGRYTIKKMDAVNLEFDENSFDGVFCTWVLEHLIEPSKVLSEARRVAHKGSPVYLTEVMNSSFFLEPYSPNTWKYWMAFNDFQHEQAGDPFVGAKLGNLLLSQGFANIQTQVKSWHFDNRKPQKRREAIRFWKNLMLSAAQHLEESKVVTKEVVEGMKEEMQTAETDPDAVFFYAFVQAYAEVT